MKRERRYTIHIVVGMMLAAAMALYFATEFAGGQFLGRGEGILTFMPVGAHVEFDMASGARFHAPGGRGFFYVTRDAIRFVNDDGRIQMIEMFSVPKQDPLLVGEGGVVGVYDPGGHYVYIFNNRGLMHSQSFENPIVNFAINARGYSAIVTKRDNDYETFVYNPNGGRTWRRVDSEVMVLSVAISPDGRILAMGALDTGGVQANSIMTFFYLDQQEAAPYSDTIFASLRGENIPELNNQIFGIIRFLDGNNLVVITDRSVFGISEAQPSRPAWVMPLNNYPDAVAFHGSHVALAMGRGKLNRTAEPMGRVILLDTQGYRVWEYDTNERVQSLDLSPHGVVIGRGRRFTAINQRNQHLWDFEAVFDSRAVIFLDSAERILLQTGTDATVMRLVRVSGGVGD